MHKSIYRAGKGVTRPRSELFDLLPEQARVVRQHLPTKGIGNDNESSMRILFVTSEIADFVKVGGLGDVSSALPRALAAHHDIRVLVPAYREMLASGHEIKLVGTLPAFAGLPACEVGEITCHDGLIIYVLLCPELYEREGNPYCDEMGIGWDDNDIRFGRLALAAAEIASGNAGIGWRPQLLHLNDWPTALAAGYLHWRGEPTPSVFTIHNLAYQGVYDPSRRQALGIPDDAFTIEGLEFYGNLSFLKAGIVYSSRITTVSATYAREITTPEFGCGLEGLLASKAEQGRLLGIPNGIDDSWDPRTDTHLAQAFAMNDWRGKRANADHVRKMFGLAVNNGPLFAVVSRLVHQKGLDMTIGVAESIVRAGGQIVFIGRGELPVENALCNLAARFPGSIGVNIGFDEGEARCMYAGSDFLLMPSRFEPCGLSQMYAQRFGSLPIAHRTGGLADTIEDGVTGFLFDEMSLSSYMQAIQRAFTVFQATDLFYAMRRAAMAGRYHWRQSIEPYTQLYRRVLDEEARGEIGKEISEKAVMATSG
ncbi:glycogen synthase GlgA [Halomonas sp. TRM85114]|uniref:glycogen synthase GlgA n=1 Tax=Halomonas jincaotanensis TaxID=2810616 RepID=UPI001BD5A68A|nr:glycogen synthase GlgA [Halomonas jincaotanensis]MBS9402792.1 glycogen synthase GlgA [Halomonas jincaotanensis]